MFSVPEKNIEQLKLPHGITIADFGAGSGAYTIACAKALFGTGKVYAVEVQKDLLTRLESTCREQHLGNVAFLWGNIELRGGTKLREDSCDLVIVSNVLFQTPDKKAVIDEAKRVLRHGGRLLLIDWTGSFNSMGPTTEQVFNETAAHTLVEPMGFTFEKSINAGNFHYGIIFKKGIYQGEVK